MLSYVGNKTLYKLNGNPQAILVPLQSHQKVGFHFGHAVIPHFTGHWKIPELDLKLYSLYFMIAKLPNSSLSCKLYRQGKR